MLKPATLVLVGLASAAAIAHAFRAPFPGPGGNPVLDLIAYHDPGFHTVIRVWYYVAPAVAVVLFGSLGLSVWRVWLQPRAGGGRRGTLPPWPASPEDETPSLVIGELHHPVVPRESERPSWLVVPETGLYTGVLIVGAVGSGKTSACMYPFAQQLLSWQADRPARRASALVLEVKGDFCHSVRGILDDAGRGGRLPGDRPRWCLAVEPARRSAARHLFARLRRRLPDQPALRQEPRTVLAASLHEPRALDHRTVPALAGGLGHAAGRLPLHDRRGAVRREDRRGPGSGRPALPGAGHRHRDQAISLLTRNPSGNGAWEPVPGTREGHLPARSRVARSARRTRHPVRDRGERGRRGQRAQGAGRGDRAVVPERLDGARCQAPHLDRRGHLRLPVALRSAASREHVLSAASGPGRIHTYV